ncbi:MAG: hypothetical protein LBG96_16610 [Tannerella sp.]|jgi:hypothetical protein|nr:hypothetical protein [Tannerella sp.]
MKTKAIGSIENTAEFWNRYYSSPAVILRDAMMANINSSIRYPNYDDDDNCTVEVFLVSLGVESCYKAMAAAKIVVSELNSISGKMFYLETAFTTHGSLAISIKEYPTYPESTGKLSF